MLYGYLIVGSPYGIMEKTIFEEIIMKNLNYLYNFKNPIIQKNKNHYIIKEKGKIYNLYEWQDRSLRL